jgi:hypothetical protein
MNVRLIHAQVVELVFGKRSREASFASGHDTGCGRERSTGFKYLSTWLRQWRRAHQRRTSKIREMTPLRRIISKKHWNCIVKRLVSISNRFLVTQQISFSFFSFFHREVKEGLRSASFYSIYLIFSFHLESTV